MDLHMSKRCHYFYALYTIVMQKLLLSSFCAILHQNVPSRVLLVMVIFQSFFCILKGKSSRDLHIAQQCHNLQAWYTTIIQKYF
jgi:hypothetical protein